MFKSKKIIKSNEQILYNNILSLSRKKLFYKAFGFDDSFENRINLIFIHISFLFNKAKHKKNNLIYKNFCQKTFDFIFKNIELNMREMGYGDVIVNKNMKLLIKTFYAILLYCEKYNVKTTKDKNIFFNKSNSITIT